MSPSSPVSIGIPLGSSNRTLEVGSAHVKVLGLLLSTIIDAHFPVIEEPFTVVGMGMVYTVGITIEKNIQCHVTNMCSIMELKMKCSLHY